MYDDLKKYTLSCIDEDRIPYERRHGYLLSHIDSDYLEDKFSELVGDVSKRVEVMQYAFDKAVETYSLDSVYKQIKKLTED